MRRGRSIRPPTFGCRPVPCDPVACPGLPCPIPILGTPIYTPRGEKSSGGAILIGAFFQRSAFRRGKTGGIGVRKSQSRRHLQTSPRRRSGGGGGGVFARESWKNGKPARSDTWHRHPNRRRRRHGGKGWRRRIERHSDGEAAENVPPWHRLTPPHGSWDTSGFQKSRGLVHPGGSRWSRSGCAADHRPIRLLMSDGRVPSVAAQESSVRCGCRFVDRRVPFGSRRATGGFRTRRHASAE